MNLKRHHVLYALVAFCLITGVLVLLTPGITGMSDKESRATTAAKTASSMPGMRFEIATSTSAQERGLGGRTSIPEDYGMLFVFATDVNVGFWMKDMQVPIDIIWLSDSGVILGIEDSISPDTYPKAFYPPQPVKYVLETKAGEARRRRWSVGSTVELPTPYALRNTH